jgi:hypothetical protein
MFYYPVVYFYITLLSPFLAQIITTITEGVCADESSQITLDEALKQDVATLTYTPDISIGMGEQQGKIKT